MVKKLTEGIHPGLFKWLDMSDDSEVDAEVKLAVQRYRFCERFGWTPKQYREQDMRDIAEFIAIMNTEAKVREVKK